MIGTNASSVQERRKKGITTMNQKGLVPVGLNQKTKVAPRHSLNAQEESAMANLIDELPQLRTRMDEGLGTGGNAFRIKLIIAKK